MWFRVEVKVHVLLRMRVNHEVFPVTVATQSFRQRSVAAEEARAGRDTAIDAYQ